MYLKLNGRKYKYSHDEFKHIDKFKIKPPDYSLYRRGKVEIDNKWFNCSFRLNKSNGKTIIEVYTTNSFINGKSDIGPVDKHGMFESVELSLYQRMKVELSDQIAILKIKAKKIYDLYQLLKANIKSIIIALSLALTYYLVNLYFDNYLLKLISENNFIQSIIIFLSISSLINIFSPFSLRRELTHKEVNSLINKKIEHLMENFDDYEDKHKKITSYNN